jgi:hypothetical protein
MKGHHFRDYHLLLDEHPEPIFVAIWQMSNLLWTIVDSRGDHRYSRAANSIT